jgi:hypothetical protein
MAVDPKEEVVEPVEEEVEEEEVVEEEEEVVEEEPVELPPLRGRRKIARKTGAIYVLNVKTGELTISKSRVVEYNRDTDLVFIYYWGDKTFRLRFIRLPKGVDKNQALRMVLRALKLV